LSKSYDAKEIKRYFFISEASKAHRVIAL